MQKQKKMGLVSPTSQRNDRQIRELTYEVAYRTRLQNITSLFEAERITVYVVDKNKRQLVSRLKSGNDIEEIRIPISAGSIAGWCALKNNIINVKDAYNASELASIDPALRFDDRWDLKTGFKTRQILARPIGFQNRLLGVIQLMNRKTGKSFVT